jgi:hypothetical protein
MSTVPDTLRTTDIGLRSLSISAVRISRMGEPSGVGPVPALPTCGMEDKDMSVVHPWLRSLVTPDGAVILDAKRNVVITLNTIGGYIWERLQNGKSVDSIVHDLVQDTGTDVTTAERDVHEFIEDLTTKRLIAPLHAIRRS